MAGFTTRAEIQKPRQEVFDAITNLENVSTLMPSVVSIEHVTDGPMREGTVFRETRKMGKKNETCDIRVSAFDPPNMYAASSDWKGSTFTYTYTLSELPGGGTELVLDCSAQLNGFFVKLMAPMMFACMKKLDGDQPARVKAMLEAQR